MRMVSSYRIPCLERLERIGNIYLSLGFISCGHCIYVINKDDI